MARILPLIVAVMSMFIQPALAQDAADPAARVPDSVSAYAEIRVDENLESRWRDLARLGALLGNQSPEEAAAQVSFDAALAQILPGATFEDDILPWLGERVGVALFGDFMAQPDPDFAVILPVTDAKAAGEFVARFSGLFPNVETEGETRISMHEGYWLATTPEFIALGTPVGIEAVMGNGAALTENAAFIETRAALPAGSLASVYFSGRWIGASITRDFNDSGAGLPGAAELFEAALRLHPAESPMEDALLRQPALNGAALAVEIADQRLDITGVLSLDADYPAPILATASAGTRLMAYIPQNAYGVFASYDAMGTLGIAGGGVSFVFLMGPAIGNIFVNIVASLDATPGPTPTPLPTPTPIPTPSADTLLDQARPFVQQAEAFLGIELDALYALLSGEYAIAIFPVENPDTQNIGMALWIQTDDPARLSQVLDSAMTVANSQLDPFLERTQETVSGLDMTVWDIADEDESLVYGVLADDVFVVTLKSSFPVVAAASRGDGVLAQSRHWPEAIAAAEYGSGLEIMAYVDIGGLAKLDPTGQPAPFEALIAGLDMQDNGLFVGRITITRTAS